MTDRKPTDAELAEMLEGLDSATAGPWEVAPAGTYPDDEGAKVLGPKGFNSRGHPVRYYVAQFVKEGDAAHMARFDPDTLRIILTELQDLRADVAQQ